MMTGAIIQARLSSSRLPGKVLADIQGRPMLWRVIDRARRAGKLELVAVATSTNPEDDQVAELCAEYGTPCFRGSLDDVLDRYYQAARFFSLDPVVRLTADCPLLDPEVIDQVIGTYEGGVFDFVVNGLNDELRTFPDGLDTAVMSFRALERAWQEARLKSEREHVVPYILNRPERFRLGNVAHDQDLSGLRWTVDEPEDLEFVRLVYQKLGPGHFGLAEVVGLLKAEPGLNLINGRFQYNEGYQKSLREDGPFDKPFRGPFRAQEAG